MVSETVGEERPTWTSDLRLVIVLDEPFWTDGRDYYCDLNWWRFGDYLARHFAGLALFVPLAGTGQREGMQRVTLEHARIEGRFHYKRLKEYYRRYWRNRTALLSRARQLFAEHDLIVFRVPSAAAVPLAKVAHQLKKPTGLFVAGDILTGTSYANVRGLKGAVAGLAARHLRNTELRIAAGAVLVAAWGKELLPVYSAVNPNTALAAAPSISRKLFYRRDDTTTGATIRLVRVARVLPNKGLEYLIRSVGELRKRGHNIELDIAGGADGQAYQDSLVRLTAALGVAERVRFHGQLPFGEELFDLYRRADVQVVSSLSEGLPRCIAEGRVFGLPTIATRVGGIPTVVQDGVSGLLIEPRSSMQIATAVERIITDGDLRRTIIQNGYEAAERETAEFQAERLARLMHRAAMNQPLGPGQRDLRKM